MLLGVGGLPPAAMAYVSDIAPEKEAGSTLGIYIVLYTFSSILSAYLGGFIIDYVGINNGLQAVFAAVAILSILTIIGSLITVKE